MSEPTDGGDVVSAVGRVLGTEDSAPRRLPDLRHLDFLDGTRVAHISINGISGVATKTATQVVHHASRQAVPNGSRTHHVRLFWPLTPSVVAEGGSSRQSWQADLDE